MPSSSRCFTLVVFLLILTIFFAYFFTTWNDNTTIKKIQSKDLVNNFVELSNVTNKKSFVNAHAMDDGTTLKRRLPKAIIIGSNKSGTRALLVFLKIHPDIKACPDEVHFFNREENYMLGLDWYRGRMPKSTAEQLTVEKSPAYFITKNVPRRVHNMSKDIKLLVIVRDPTVRAISEYTQLALKSNSSLPKFEIYVTKNQNAINSERGIVKSGVYIKYLNRWLKFFPHSQIHFVSGEQLIKNPAAEIKLVEKFLNLRPMITEKNFYFNKTKGFPCFIGKIGLHGKKKTGCLKGTKGRKHFPVRDDVVKLLQDYYRPFNQELYKVVHRDFHWA